MRDSQERQPRCSRLRPAACRRFQRAGEPRRSGRLPTECQIGRLPGALRANGFCGDRARQCIGSRWERACSPEISRFASPVSQSPNCAMSSQSSTTGGRSSETGVIGLGPSTCKDWSRRTMGGFGLKAGIPAASLPPQIRSYRPHRSPELTAQVRGSVADVILGL